MRRRTHTWLVLACAGCAAAATGHDAPHDAAVAIDSSVAAPDGADDAAPPQGDAARPPAPDAGPTTDGAVASTAPARYPAGILHSPMTAAVIARLRAVLAATPGRDTVFAKVGDSITVDSNFLDCFAGNDIMLDTHAALSPTRDWFNQTLVDGTHTSWNRTSLAAAVGWQASKALAGSPTPIDQEVAAISPAFAVVMFGTNETDPCCVEAFEKNLTGVVDALLGHGVVPLVSTIPPRGDSATANALVPEMNAVVRAVAQHRQVPYMDFWQTLVPLTSFGLSPDGVHPQVYVMTGAHGCWLTPAGLTEGQNQRNLITLTSFDRARRFLLAGDPADADVPPLAGAGSWASPFVVDALPFVDVADTSISPNSTADVYSCAPQNESGPEWVYQVTIDHAATLRARVFVDAGVDVDLHWLSAASAASCISRADKVLDITVAQPGTYYLSLDTFVSSGVVHSGAFRVTLVEL